MRPPRILAHQGGAAQWPGNSGRAFAEIVRRPVDGVELDIHVAADGEPVATEGIVATQIYQGGHVDIHVDVAAAASGRVLIRLPGHGAMARWPVGTRLGIAIIGADAVAFPRAAG